MFHIVTVRKFWVKATFTIYLPRQFLQEGSSFDDFYHLPADYAFTNNVSHCCKSQGSYLLLKEIALAR
jgi:hypothetical protein